MGRPKNPLGSHQNPERKTYPLSHREGYTHFAVCTWFLVGTTYGCPRLKFVGYSLLAPTLSHVTCRFPALRRLRFAGLPAKMVLTPTKVPTQYCIYILATLHTYLGLSLWVCHKTIHLACNLRYRTIQVARQNPLPAMLGFPLPAMLGSLHEFNPLG